MIEFLVLKSISQHPVLESIVSYHIIEETGLF